MAHYRSRPTVVEAYRYNGQPPEDWPVWLQEYRGTTAMAGQVKIARDAVGHLLIPAPGGIETVRYSDMVFIDEAGEIHTLTDQRFHERYEEIAEPEPAADA